eukprot:TRINITY_DN6757_c0_g1_i1.p1 TRINITY_DN6757_c0_g1~~TRINITY_DN6757_c0_g1_i1.p1  ORF type:complete len:425 (-),score=62.22 TRINITY_DN6757_c0_g1_i1:965-2239(-)
MQATPNHDTWKPLYPLYCMKVEDLLEMNWLESHEELLAKGTIVQYEPGMVVIFTSHEWLSRGHPDPYGDQFSVLQTFLKNAIEGNVRIQSYWMSFLYFNRDESMDVSLIGSAYIWFDYFSIPQMKWITASDGSSSVNQDFVNAVNSIHIYVAICKYFFVLCPSLQHYDTGKFCDFLSWSKRGWCQCEETCRRLAHFNEMVVVITGSQQAVLHDSQDYLSHPIGELDFTCCDLNHVQNGKEIPCDKAHISTVLQFYLAKLEDETKENIFHCRLLKSLSPGLLAGMPNLPQFDHGNTEAFLSAFGFGTAASDSMKKVDDAGAGWAPLFWASLLPDPGVMTELVRRGHAVDVRSQGKAKGVLLERGSTPLIAAAMLSSSGLAVRTLLHLKADPNARNEKHLSPLGAGWHSCAVLAQHSAGDSNVLAT